MNNEKLFTLRLKLSSGMAIISVWEGPFMHPNHTKLDCELRQNGKIVFPRGATWCGVPSHESIDGIYAKEIVCSLFAMKPGDTDKEYFESYTSEQLDWAEDNGEELDMIKQDRYCDPETGEIRR